MIVKYFYLKAQLMKRHTLKLNVMCWTKYEAVHNSNKPDEQCWQGCQSLNLNVNPKRNKLQLLAV